MQIKRELNLLQKLYGLYNDVIDTVNGYYDILWQDVNIEKINQELLDFQNRWVPCGIDVHPWVLIYLRAEWKRDNFIFCLFLDAVSSRVL